MNTELEKISSIISSSKKMVFFGGAGVSTESGIPDFRSASGLFTQGEVLSPERIVSRSFFLAHPEEFYEFYREKMIYRDAQPNPAHRALACLEEKGVLEAVITQNIDGLHQAAGSKKVVELHGNIHRNHCIGCQKVYPLEFILENKPIPYCLECNSLVRPDVVLYEEPLEEQNISDSIRLISSADTFIIGGTSLVVNPAASLVEYFAGKHLVIINKDDLAFAQRPSLLIKAPIGEVLGKVVLGI